MFVSPLSAFLIFFGANPISWSSIKQRTIAYSFSEVENLAIVAAAVTELQWVKSLLSELFTPVHLLPTLFSDNFGVTYLSNNHVFHSLVKTSCD